MRLEHIPLIIGAIVALIGLGFIADALMADSAPDRERRRRMRAERSRPGETIVGVGTLCIAAALIGRDTWRYGTVAVLAGAVLVLVGVILNRTFLKETLFFRGPARRGDGKDESRHANRSSRLGASAPSPAGSAPKAGRASTPAGPRPPVGAPATAAATPRSPAAPPRPMASAAIETPVAPMRKLETSAPPSSASQESPARPEASPPSGPPERRKTPRGKK